MTTSLDTVRGFYDALGRGEVPCGGNLASGHVNFICRPNTWLHRPSLRREHFPCQSGAVHTLHITTCGPKTDIGCFWAIADIDESPARAHLCDRGCSKLSGRWRSR
jgi:hypothetical protein